MKMNTCSQSTNQKVFQQLKLTLTASSVVPDSLSEDGSPRGVQALELA